MIHMICTFFRDRNGNYEPRIANFRTCVLIFYHWFGKWFLSIALPNFVSCILWWNWMWLKKWTVFYLFQFIIWLAKTWLVYDSFLRSVRNIYVYYHISRLSFNHPDWTLLISHSTHWKHAKGFRFIGHFNIWLCFTRACKQKGTDFT